MDPEKQEGTGKDQGTPADEQKKDAPAPLPKTLKEALALNPEYDQEYKDELQREGDRRATEAVKTREQKERERAEKEAKEKELAALPEAEKQQRTLLEKLIAIEAKLDKVEKKEAIADFKIKLKAVGLPESLANSLHPETDLGAFKKDYLASLKDKDVGGEKNPKGEKKKDTPLCTSEEKEYAKLRNMSEEEYAAWRDNPEAAAKKYLKKSEK